MKLIISFTYEMEVNVIINQHQLTSINYKEYKTVKMYCRFRPDPGPVTLLYYTNPMSVSRNIIQCVVWLWLLLYGLISENSCRDTTVAQDNGETFDT